MVTRSFRQVEFVIGIHGGREEWGGPGVGLDTVSSLPPAPPCVLGMWLTRPQQPGPQGEAGPFLGKMVSGRGGPGAISAH